MTYELCTDKYEVHTTEYENIRHFHVTMYSHIYTLLMKIHYKYFFFFNICLDEKDLKVIIELYCSQAATMRLGGDSTENVLIQRGVNRRGCILSPCF